MSHFRPAVAESHSFMNMLQMISLLYLNCYGYSIYETGRAEISMGTQAVTKEAIARKTKNLLRRMSVENLSVTKICQEVGINRSTFYRHFLDKFEVINWIYYHDFFETMPRNPDWNIWDYFSVIQNQLYSDRSFYVNAFHYEGQNSFREYSTGILKDIIYKDYDGIFKDQEIEDFFIDHALDMTFDACEAWLSSDPCPPPEKFSQDFKTNFLRFAQRGTELIQESFNRPL